MTIDDDFMLMSKDHKILELVYKFRFINRKQIQKIFGYKDPKSVNVLLKRLVEHNYLGRIYSTKLLENTKPAIYYLGSGGIGWVRTNYFEDEPLKVKRFYQDKHASQRFIDHCIALADLYIQHKQLGEKNNHKYNFCTSSEMWYDFGDILKNIRPDALVERLPVDDKSTEKDHSYFLELFDYSIPMYAFKYKIDQYIVFRSETDDWDIFSPDYKSLEIRMIFQSSQKLGRVGKYLQEKLDESYDVEYLTFLLTTLEKITDEGIEDNKIWKVIKAE